MGTLNRILYVIFSRIKYANYYRAIKRGMIVGDHFFGQNSIYDKNYPWLIKIGNNVTITHSTILAHDESMKKHLHVTSVGAVTIDDNVFVGFNSTILPGVNIGSNAIIAAGSLVNRDVKAGTVVGGVPAKQIKTVDDFVEKQQVKLSAKRTQILDYSEISNEMKKDLYANLSTNDDVLAFVKD